MGNVALEVGETDRKISAWLAAFFAAESLSLVKVLADSRMSAEDKKAKRASTITQTSLARAVGMSETRMSRRMTGEQPWSNVDVERIALLLGVDENKIRKGPRKK